VGGWVVVVVGTTAAALLDVCVQGPSSCVIILFGVLEKSFSYCNNIITTETHCRVVVAAV